MIALIVTGCSTEPDINADEHSTINSDLEASLASMQSEIDELNEKLEQTSSTTATTQQTATTEITTTEVKIYYAITTRYNTYNETTSKPLPIIPNVIGMTVLDACIAFCKAGFGGYDSGGYPDDYIVTAVSPSVGTPTVPARVVQITAAEPPEKTVDEKTGGASLS